jgi:hypothetical protein
VPSESLREGSKNGNKNLKSSGDKSTVTLCSKGPHAGGGMVVYRQYGEVVDTRHEQNSKTWSNPQAVKVRWVGIERLVKSCRGRLS